MLRGFKLELPCPTDPSRLEPVLQDTVQRAVAEVVLRAFGDKRLDTAIREAEEDGDDAAAEDNAAYFAALHGSSSVIQNAVALDHPTVWMLLLEDGKHVLAYHAASAHWLLVAQISVGTYAAVVSKRLKSLLIPQDD